MKFLPLLLVFGLFLIGCQNESNKKFDFENLEFDFNQLKEFKKYVPKEYKYLNDAIFEDQSGKQLVFSIGYSVGKADPSVVERNNKYSYNVNLSNNDGLHIGFNLSYIDVTHRESLIAYIINRKTESVILEGNKILTVGESETNNKGSLASVMLEYSNDKLTYDSKSIDLVSSSKICGEGYNFSYKTSDNFDNKMCIEVGKGITYFEFEGVGYTLKQYGERD